MNYLDNASTSFPKPKSVMKSINKYIKKNGMNGNRTFSKKGMDVLTKVYETRTLIAELVNHNNPNTVIFTSGATESINTILKGYLKKGDHVIISNFEHNAVVRTLASMEGVEYSTFDVSASDIAAECQNKMKSNTKAIITVHASNVTGEIFKVDNIKEVVRKNNIKLILDASQTIGQVDINMERLGVDALIFPGHKSLLGPQGIGGFVIDTDFAEEVMPLINGGTGSHSEELIQPNIIPEKFECGTQNYVGIYGLNASLRYLKDYGVANVKKHHDYLKQELINGLEKFESVQIVRKNMLLDTAGIVSIFFDDNDNMGEKVFNELIQDNIVVRVGKHCAPLAHKSLNTTEKRVIRISFSIFNKKKDIKNLLKVISAELEKADVSSEKEEE